MSAEPCTLARPTCSKRPPGTPYDRHNVGRSLRRTLKRAVTLEDKPTFATGERRPSLHGFRHTTATVLLNSGTAAPSQGRHRDAGGLRP
jgi:integrase